MMLVFYAALAVLAGSKSSKRGIYSKGRLRCPLHGAGYNVKTGDIEDYPGFGCLFTYDVREENGDLIINTTEKQLESLRRIPRPLVQTLNGDLPIVVVGAGVSAAIFVERARLNGCAAPITMISDDDLPPYDRPMLSKKPFSEVKEILIRQDDFYKENHIEIMLNTRVTAADFVRRKVMLSTGESIQYSKLVLALGGSPNHLPVPGGDLKNVYTLRKVSDAHTIANASKGKHLVCIGASFIGMEMSSALSATASSVTVICQTDEPVPSFGEDIGAVIRKRFEARGVKVMVKATVKQLEGEEAVTGVTLESGETIPADVVVVGIGVKPRTEWLKNSSLEIDEGGFIKVDDRFRTSVDLVYAIGDSVAAPLSRWGLESHNIQHFQVAQTHGQLLGYSIVGRPFPHPIIPLFWTAFFLHDSPFGLRFAGCPVGTQETIIHGSIEEMSFAKYFLKDDVVVAVASAGNSVANVFLELFERNIPVSREDVEKNINDDWMPWLSDGF